MRSIASVAKSIRSASPSAPSSEASWSSSPVSAPTQSFSTREHSFASSTRSGSAAPATLEQREAQRGLQRGRGGEARALRHVALDRQPRGRELDAGGGELATVPRTNARQPSARGGSGERERVALAEVARLRLDAVAVQPLGGHGDAAVDRERQREPAVVVGVLADQVDAAGAARADANRDYRDRRRRRLRHRREDGGARAGSARRSGRACWPARVRSSARGRARPGSAPASRPEACWSCAAA